MELYQKRGDDLKKLEGDAISRTGARGQLAGNEAAAVLSGSQTIATISADSMVITTSGATTLTFTPAGNDVWCIKGICLKASAATTLTVNGAVWANGAEAPAWGDSGKTLVLAALFAGGQVILSVCHNDQ